MMSKETDQYSSELDRQAADWFVVVSDPQVDEEQLVAFMQWLNTSLEHEAAYERVERTWMLLERINSSRSEQEEVEQMADDRSKGQGTISRYVRWSTAIAASFLVSFISYFYLLDAGNDEFLLLETSIGEQKTQQLSDGTEIVLNTYSKVRVEYAKNVRRVYLDKGEVYFNVAKQLDRPFIVNAVGGQIKALGTAFNVRLLDDEEVVVSLVEGRVAVAPELDAQASILLPGQQAKYHHKDSFVHLQDVDLEAVTQWRSGQLRFVGEPLNRAIVEINRYTSKPLVILDEGIGEELIDAYFQIDNLDNFLGGLDRLFGIKAVYQERKILLKSSEPADRVDIF